MDLTPLLEAKSVALIGASRKHGSVGQQAEEQLRQGGFRGELTLVNPNYPDMKPTLDNEVDLAVLAVANRHLPDQVELALEAGARSLAIFASCFGSGPDGSPLQDWLKRRLAGIPVCGGNGMGFINLDCSLRVCGFYQPFDLKPGPITFISHSGSLFTAMLHNRRGMRFNLVVSAGNELSTTISDYLRYAAAIPTTRVVGMFLETVRDRVGLSEALTAAAERDLPVVVLKVGRSARGAAAVTTHSAGLAGAYEPFAAFARAYGAHLVDSIDEMSDTLAIFTSERRATASGLGAVGDSGGERTLLMDRAEVLGVELATITTETRKALSGILDEGLEPANPVDAWGTGKDANQVIADSLRALGSDPQVGVLALAVDLTSEESGLGYSSALAEVAAEVDQPTVVLANLAHSVDQTQVEYLDSHGVPVLRGTDPGLLAIGHLLHHRTRLPRTTSALDPAWESWRQRLEGKLISDVEAMELLSFAGLSVAMLHPVDSQAEAVERASAVGYPVTLKGLGLAHKLDAGALRLDLGTEAELVKAWADLSKLRLPIALQAMAEPGVEIALGMVNDPQVGPVMLIAAGGTLVEFHSDRVMVVPPIDEVVASRLLGSLNVDRLLTGFRGRPALPREPVVTAIVAFSELVTQIGHLVNSIDVNPVIVNANGAIAVDVLIL